MEGLFEACFVGGGRGLPREGAGVLVGLGVGCFLVGLGGPGGVPLRRCWRRGGGFCMVHWAVGTGIATLLVSKK